MISAWFTPARFQHYGAQRYLFHSKASLHSADSVMDRVKNHWKYSLNFALHHGVPYSELNTKSCYHHLTEQTPFKLYSCWFWNGTQLILLKETFMEPFINIHGSGLRPKWQQPICDGYACLGEINPTNLFSGSWWG